MSTYLIFPSLSIKRSNFKDITKRYDIRRICIRVI